MTVEVNTGNKRKITDFFSVSKKKKSEKQINTKSEKNNKTKVVKKVVKEVIKEDASSIDENEEKTTNNNSNDSKSIFNKEKYIESLTTEQKYLLDLEINTMEDSWFELLHKEFTKPYFIELKKFLIKEWNSNTPIFPPREDIYSWTRLTPLKNVKVLIIGQDPYHNFNQAHGLAFSVKDKNTRIPPSLMNIFKGIKNDYPDFQAPKNGDLTKWAKEGVLMLNTCLTVRAHLANSHSKRGWEEFTAAVVRELALSSSSLVIIAWGKPAQSLVQKLHLASSGTQTSILKKFYWLEADCSNFPGSPISSTCRWTNYGLCGVSDGSNSDCTHAVAAYPFSPARNFNSNENLPQNFIDKSSYYYYVSRTGYGFSLVGLAFLVASWFPYFANLFTKSKFTIIKTIFWILYAAAAIFIITGISLSTAAYSRGRSHFRDAGVTSNFGTKVMATAWTTFFLVLFNIGFLIGSFIKIFGKRDSEIGNNNINNNNSNLNHNESAIYIPKFKTPWFKSRRETNLHQQEPVLPIVAQNDTLENNGINNLSFTPVKDKPLSGDFQTEKETPTTLYN
ncbi:uracil DNA glycosylase [Pichia californica]|nr:uracil DNA glycosylase [[Candida] californica]